MLENSVVVISGGAGLLGRVFVETIIGNGGKVIIGDVCGKEEISSKINLGEAKIHFYRGDMSDPSLVSKMIEEGLEKFGKIDAGIHCAYPKSSQWGTRFEDLKPKGLEKDLMNQLGGAILFSQQILRVFERQGYGNLIHISSIQGVSAPKFEHYTGTNMVSPIEYSAIKAGIIAITRYLAKYCKNKNIRVNCISPGGILNDQPDSFQKEYQSSCLSKGLLEARDIAGTLTFLLSKNSEYISGQNIIVDDGWML